MRARQRLLPGAGRSRRACWRIWRRLRAALPVRRLRGHAARVLCLQNTCALSAAKCVGAAHCCGVFGLIGNSPGSLAEQCDQKKGLRQGVAGCAMYPWRRGRRAGSRALRGGRSAGPRQLRRAVPSSRPLQSLPPRIRGLAAWQRGPPTQADSSGYGRKSWACVVNRAEHTRTVQLWAPRGLPEGGSTVARQQVQEGCRAPLDMCSSARAAVSCQRAAGALVAVCQAPCAHHGMMRPQDCKSYAITQEHPAG